jgi:phosphoenolpyruvate carboxykinase (ATP)
MKIAHTRAMIRAILEGKLATAPFATHPNFGVRMPEACPDVPADVLNPKNTWRDKAAYDAAAREVAKRFETNFAKFEPFVDGKIKAAAIRAAA